MLISPIIFCTVVLGIAGAGDMKKVGRVGGKALIYFEVVSTSRWSSAWSSSTWSGRAPASTPIPATLDANAVADYAKRATAQTTTDFILRHHPDDVPRRVHRVRRSAAGPVRGHPVRLRDDAHGRTRRAGAFTSSRRARTSSSR